MSDDLLLSLPDDENSGPAVPAAVAEAHAHAARGDWTKAERLFEAARGDAARAGDEVALAVALTNRGQALARLGRLEEAALILDAALDARRRLHATGVAGEGVVARGVADVAAVAAALGDPTEAARLLRRARAHAVAGDAPELVAAIDERLMAARTLGASDEDADLVAAAGLEPLEPAAPAAPASEPGGPELGMLEAFGPVELDADGADHVPALTFLDADPLLEEEPLSPTLELEPLVDGGSDSDESTAAGDALPLLDTGALVDEAPAFDAGYGLGAELLLDAAPTAPVDSPPAFEPAAPIELPAGVELLAGVELVAGTPSPEPLAMSAARPELAHAEPVDATIPMEWLAPTGTDAGPAAEDDCEGAGEDPWSQVDPAPFDSLDAEDVHSRAVALDTSPRGYPAVALEPDELASADALLALDEEGEPAAEPAPGVASPTSAAPQPRRRTTRDVPLVPPPESKRPWWRRLTGSRG